MPRRSTPPLTPSRSSSANHDNPTVTNGLRYGCKLCCKKHLRFSGYKPIFWHDNRDDYSYGAHLL